MINIISKWAGELIVSLVIVTLIEMLLPDNKIKKYVKTVIGIYIIFCIISPFINKKEFATIFENAERELGKIQIDNQVSAELKNTDDGVEALYIKEFEKGITNKIEELGYEVKKINVDIEINASKENAGINAIYITIGNKKNSNNGNIQIENIEKVEISINGSNLGKDKDEPETEDSKKVKKYLSDYYEISEEKIKITQN